MVVVRHLAHIFESPVGDNQITRNLIQVEEPVRFFDIRLLKAQYG